MEHVPDRTHLIRRIVREESVATQEDLVRALRRRGIAVTQATVSRDIKRLGLVKVPAGDGRHRYALPGAPAGPPPDAAARLRSVVEEFVLGVETALDLILVKTERGGAAPVAQAIDDVQWPDVAGTLAGEDTIIVVPRTCAVGRQVVRRLRRLMTS